MNMSSRWLFNKCPGRMKKAILSLIAELEIREIKKEEEFREIGDGIGPPDFVPTGRMTYTIQGYRPRKKP